MMHYNKNKWECNNSIPGDNDIRCGATIWAPSLTPHFVEDRAFSLYAMRTQQIEDLINILSARADWEDFAVQCEAYDAVGIDSDTFTDAEIEYIVNSIRKNQM